MRRCWLVPVTGTLVLLGVAAGLALVLPPPRHRISREGFEQIRHGMTRAEVEALLGGPPGVYTTGAATPASQPSGPDWLDWLPQPGEEVRSWTADDVAIFLVFRHGRVVRKRLEPMSPDPRSPLQRFLSNLLGE